MNIAMWKCKAVTLSARLGVISVELPVPF